MKVVRDLRLLHGELPVCLLESDLSPMAKLLWGVLDSFGKEIYAGRKAILKRMGMAETSTKSLDDYLHELQSGWLVIESGQDKGKTNTYVLTLPESCFAGGVGPGNPRGRVAEPYRVGPGNPTKHLSEPLKEALKPRKTARELLEDHLQRYLTFRNQQFLAPTEQDPNAAKNCPPSYRERPWLLLVDAWKIISPIKSGGMTLSESATRHFHAWFNEEQGNDFGMGVREMVEQVLKSKVESLPWDCIPKPASKGTTKADRMPSFNTEEFMKSDRLY